MDLNLLVKILIAIVVIGMVIKSAKFIGGMLFKVALIGLCLLFFYNILINI